MALFGGEVSMRKYHHEKGRFYFFKGNMLWKHHAYQSNRKSKSIMLSYDADGNEIYFNNWKDAKRYIRRMPKRVELEFPE